MIYGNSVETYAYDGYGLHGTIRIGPRLVCRFHAMGKIEGCSQLQLRSRSGVALWRIYGTTVGFMAGLLATLLRPCLRSPYDGYGLHGAIWIGLGLVCHFHAMEKIEGCSQLQLRSRSGVHYGRFLA
jgi:hypothetical protein